MTLAITVKSHTAKYHFWLWFLRMSQFDGIPRQLQLGTVTDRIRSGLRASRNGTLHVHSRSEFSNVVSTSAFVENRQQDGASDCDFHGRSRCAIARANDA